MNTDHNLLFGVLALQADLLDADRFAKACALWATDKKRLLADIVVEQGWLSAADRADVDKLLRRKLQKHKWDVKASLAEVANAQVRQSLASVSDADVQKSLAQHSTPTPADTARSTIDLAPVDHARYKRSRLHATGGLGRVWVAWDDALGREVALKEIRPEREQNSAVSARFLQEAKITGQLEHPGIVPVYDLSPEQKGDRPFYTMRLVRGRTFAQAIHAYHAKLEHGEARPLDLRELLTAFVGVCNAVAYAHSRNVVHRDLKPQNVVLGDFGEVIVLDWGLAKVLGEKENETSDAAPIALPAESDGRTVAGQVLGTPAYMAPEQAEGRADLLDARTDVYGLGAVLYELLTGRVPFTGEDTAAVLRRVIHEPPKPPRRIVATTPPALEAICLRCLAKTPRDRYPGAKAIADEVQRWLADEPVAAYREPLAARTGRWARRHQPFLAGTLTAAIVLAMSITFFAVHHVREQDRLETEAETSQRQLLAQANIRQLSGVASAQANDMDRAIVLLSDAAGFCAQSESLRDKQQEVTGQLRQLERLRDFRARAAKALKLGVHNIRDAEGPDRVFQDCEEALAILDISRKRDWHKALDPGLIGPPAFNEVRKQAHELLLLAAIRLAMFDTRDEAGKANTERALDLLDRAADLEEPGTGVWTLRMFWNRRLLKHAEANHAGDMAEWNARSGKTMQARDYYLLGSITLQVLKKPGEAIGLYQKALQREPNHYGAHFGTFLCHADDAPAQIAPLTACLALRPDVPELYYFRGMAYFKMEQHQQAFLDFDASVMRDPKYKVGYFYRGRMRVVSKHWAEAEHDFDLALHLDKDYTHARVWRAIALAYLGRAQEAANDAEKAIAAEPTKNLTLFYAARAYAQSVPAAQDAAEQYGKRAVELLRAAVDLGYRDVERIRGNEFAPIRSRGDYQQFLKEVKKSEGS